MNAIITGLTAQWNPVYIEKTSASSWTQHETARSADQRLTYLATELLPVCRDMQAKVHVSPPAPLNT